MKPEILDIENLLGSCDDFDIRGLVATEHGEGYANGRFAVMSAVLDTLHKRTCTIAETDNGGADHYFAPGDIAIFSGAIDSNDLLGNSIFSNTDR